jgi:hypothetical protein
MREMVSLPGSNGIGVGKGAESGLKVEKMWRKQ